MTCNGVHSSKVRLKYDNAYQVTSSLAKGYDPSALLKMSTADRIVTLDSEDDQVKVVWLL